MISQFLIGHTESLLVALFSGLLLFLAFLICLRQRKRMREELKRRIHFEQTLYDTTKKLDTSYNRLARDHRQLEAVLSSLGEGLIVYDSECRIKFMSQIGGMLLKIAPGAGMGRDIRDLFQLSKHLPDEKNKIEEFVDKTADAVRMELARVAKRADMLRYWLEDDMYCKTNRGGVFPIAATITSVLDGTHVIGGAVIFRDISKEKMVMRARSEFISFASHQLRSPLSTIAFYTEILLSGESGKITTTQREHLNEIDGAIKQMSNLVQLFLDASKVELGTFELNPKIFEVCPIIETTINLFAPKIQEKGLTIRHECTPEALRVFADKDYFEVMLQNLISNAIKYVPEKKGVIEIFASLNDGRVLIKITDNGYGIPEQYQQHIFSKMYRAENVKRRDPRGVGLGLYMVKEIVDRSGGMIWFTSKENIGTTFSVELPSIHGAQTDSGVSDMERANGAVSKI